MGTGRVVLKKSPFPFFVPCLPLYEGTPSCYNTWACYIRRVFLRHLSLRSLTPVFRWDKAFTKRLLLVALPIMFQNLVSSSLHIIDGIMVSSLGTAPYAAVTQMSRYMFLFNITLFGVVSGSSIYLAQYWGKKDIGGMRTVMGMCFRITLPLGLLFGGTAILFPQLIVSFFLPSGESASYAREYLQIVAFGMIITAADTVFASAMKSSEQTFIPMLAGIAAILTNTVLNYALIYGHFGFPALGVQGAAIATVISSGVSLAINAGASYLLKLPSGATLHQLVHFDPVFFKRYLKTVFPVILNEGFWALGYTMYSVFFGRLGDAAVAAQGIYNTVDQLIFVTIYGLMHATAIIVGRSIGAGAKEEAYLYAKRLLVTALGLGLVMGVAMFATRHLLVSFFTDVSPQTRNMAAMFMVYAALFAWAKSFNCVNIVGVLRSGGDTMFTMLLDICSIWCLGVPAVGLAALVFHWPVEAVFLLTAAEEAPKLVIGLKRMISKKWINDLTHKPRENAA